MIKYLTIIFVILLPSIGFAVNTGKFNQNINISGSPRNVAFYVPEDYSPDKNYPFIISLHYGGSDGETMRQIMQPVAEKLKIILACPDEYYGNGETIDPTLQWTQENYKIDEEKIVISGYSMGGGLAFEYANNNTSSTAGFIGIAPAIQNPQAIDYSKFNGYSIALIVGELDFFLEDAESIIENSGDAGAENKLIVVPEVDHIDEYFYTGDFQNKFIECWDFIFGQSSTVDNQNDIVQISVNNQILMIDKLRGQYNLNIYDLRGNPVHSNILNIFSDDFTESLPDNIIKGVYCLVLENDGVLIKKLILIN